MAWEPGKSGNPKGRPKDPARDELRQLAREYTRQALDTIVAVMNDATAKPGIRLKAADILLDRAWGKAAPVPPEVEEKETKTATTTITVAPGPAASQ